MHSSPYKDPHKLRSCSVPALLAPRPCSTFVPPIPTTVTKMTKRYMPVTEELTPPISPARVVTDPATPPPANRTGRGRGRGKWRAQSSETPGVGTRSRTRQAEAAATQARPNKLRVWHVIYNYRIHQRIDSEIHRGHYRRSRSTRIKTRSGLPARRWWRRGGIDPSEHGSSGVDPPCGPITCDTAPRGPSLSSSLRYAPEISVHHALGAHRSRRPARGLAAMGRSHALPRGTVE